MAQMTDRLIEGLEILLGARPRSKDKAALRRSDLASIDQRAAETVRSLAVPREGAQLPTYANESAAATAGLKTGTIYMTATGELRIKL